MEKETLKNIFSFLEKNEKRKTPFLWKWENNIPLTEDDLHIKGDLDLLHAHIESLPDNLYVGGDLNLMNSYVEELPEGLEVGGDLILVGTEIESLPEGLVVGGGLYLRGLKIQSLPKGLKVGKNLLIYDTPLANLSYTEILNMIEPDGYIMGELKKE